MPTLRLLISFCWIYYLVFWVAAARKTKANAERQPWRSFLHHSLYIFLGAIVLSYDIVPWGINRRMFADSPAALMAGAAATVAGLAVAVWARCILGKNWSGTVTIKLDHELVQHGPYRWVRNPIYTGVLLMFVGTAAALGQVRGLVGVALVFWGFWLKIRQEEAFMRRQFPVAFPEYQRRVKSLIPYML
ncbi:MAG: methyltransferase family protein [Terriglobales bacterium]